MIEVSQGLVDFSGTRSMLGHTCGGMTEICASTGAALQLEPHTWKLGYGISAVRWEQFEKRGRGRASLSRALVLEGAHEPRG